MRELMRSLDSNVPVLSVRTMEAIFQGVSVQGMNLVVTLLGSLGIMGLILALAGLYAVVAYQVARRTREIGIRMAIGAQRPEIMRMILGRAAAMGIAGVAAGVVLTYVLRGVLNAGGTDPQQTDPWPFILVPLALLVTSVLAAAIPARHASRIDPQVTLREE
jgi:ABC-type antimicrobial peptide transport system permease subunit